MKCEFSGRTRAKAKDDFMQHLATGADQICSQRCKNDIDNTEGGFFYYTSWATTWRTPARRWSRARTRVPAVGDTGSARPR